MINKINSIQSFCFTYKAIFTLIFLFSSLCGIFSQNGEYIIDGSGADSFTLGTNSTTGFFASPFISGRKNTRVQYLYEATEVGLFNAEYEGFRVITSIAFEVLSLSNTTTLPLYEMQNISISMGHTNASFDTGLFGTANVWGVTMPPAGECTWEGSPTPEYLTQVKGPFNLVISQAGWVVLPLDVPFVWDGVSSIVVEICKSDPRSNSPSTNFNTASYRFAGIQIPNTSATSAYALTRSFYSSVNSGTTHTQGCEMVSGSPNTTTSSGSALTAINRKIRPNIRFTFQCNGSPKGGDAVIQSENYCLGEDVTISVINGDKSSGLIYQWQSTSTDPEISNDYSYVSGTGATLSVQRAEVDMWYRRTVECGYETSTTRYSAPIKVKGINTWDGTFWSFGSEPTINDPVKISGDFDTELNGVSLLEACSLNVTSGTFIVKSGDIVSLKEKLFVHEDATVVFENNSSLIQENDAVVNEGKIIYKRDSKPVRLLDYTYWSSPVSGMTLSQFSPGTPTNRIYHWNHLTTGPNPQSWVGGVANLPMIAGKGYIVRAPNGYPSTGTGNVFSGAFEGVPNNGLISVPAQGELEKWNLIGNPYPAAIDIDKFLIANSSILEGSIRLWTHNTLPSAIPSYPGFSTQALNYSSDDYATYNLTGSIGIPADNTGANNTSPGQFVGAGQSFMVAGNGGSSDNVIFNNDMRKKVTDYDNSQFFRYGTVNHAQAEKNRLWLEVIHQNGKFNQTLVGFVQGATNDLDWGYDTKFRHTGDVKIYTIVGESKLAIQGKSLPFNTSENIPVGLTTALSGEFLLNLYQFDGLFENQEVYLFDKYNNTIHNIKEGVYAFTSMPGTFDDRFELQFTNEILSLNPIINSNNTILCYVNNSQIIIKSKDSDIQSIQVFDSSGRLLFDKSNMNHTEVVITDVAKNNQLLVVQVTTVEDIKSINKIIF